MNPKPPVSFDFNGQRQQNNPITLQININSNNNDIGDPIFAGLPNVQHENPVGFTPMPILPPRPLSTPILQPSNFGFPTLDDDNESEFDFSYIPRDDIVFCEEKDTTIGFDDNDWTNFKGFLTTDT